MKRILELSVDEVLRYVQEGLKKEKIVEEAEKVGMAAEISIEPRPENKLKIKVQFYRVEVER